MNSMINNICPMDYRKLSENFYNYFENISNSTFQIGHNIELNRKGFESSKESTIKSNFHYFLDDGWKE